MSIYELIRQKLNARGESLLELDLYIAPRASRSKIAAIYDKRLKIQLKAVPVDGAANAELLAFLAGLFKLPKSNLELCSGQTSKRKTASIRGLALEEAVRILSNSLKHAK